MRLNNAWGRDQRQPVGISGRWLRQNSLNQTSYNYNEKQLTRRYTAAEVKAYLRGIEKGPRAAQPIAHAAHLSTMLDARMVRHFRGRERLFDKLPFVLYQYTQGKPTDQIAQSVSYFADGNDVEEAMDFVAKLIARKINRRVHI